MNQKPISYIRLAFERAWDSTKENFPVMIANTLLFIVSLPLCIITLIGIFFIPAFYGGFVRSMLDLAQGKSVKIGDFFNEGLQKADTLLGMALLYIITLPFAFAFLIVPGVYLLVVWSFVPFILMDSSLSVLDVFKKSYYLVKPRWWDVFWLFMIAGVIKALVTPIGYIVAMPFIAMVYAHYYFLLTREEIEPVGRG